VRSASRASRQWKTTGKPSRVAEVELPLQPRRLVAGRHVLPVVVEPDLTHGHDAALVRRDRQPLDTRQLGFHVRDFEAGCKPTAA
jgi:hypothetical protein